MSDPTGHRESPDTADAPTGDNLVDGTPGHDRSDGGERDFSLTTDDSAQREDSEAQPGND